MRDMRRLVRAARHTGHRLGQSVFADTFGIAVVRNPWDWAVSGWKHVTENTKAHRPDDKPDFGGFMTGGWRRGLRHNPNPMKSRSPEMFVRYHCFATQWDHLRAGAWRAPVPLAFTACFESLKRDWGLIRERLGVSAEIPHKNRPRRASYQRYDTDELAELVGRANAPLDRPLRLRVLALGPPGSGPVAGGAGRRRPRLLPGRPGRRRRVRPHRTGVALRVLLTGAAGFIGSHVAVRLLAEGHRVLGIDDLNDYYDPRLKHARLARFEDNPGFAFERLDLAEHDALLGLGRRFGPELVVHLAAQAGVRHSLEAPFDYARSNLTGHLAVLELARATAPRHVVYASSSSVYGANGKVPFSEGDRVDRPVSLYGATKKAGEALSSSYATLYRIPLTGLRLFSVYGPWGRPDMACWLFTEKMLAGEEIRIFNHGRMARDFTFIDDIVSGILLAARHPPGPEDAFHRVLNLGNDRSEALMALVEAIEAGLGVTARKVFVEMQKGDVERTWADISRARDVIGYAPSTGLAEGIARTLAWRRSELFPL